MAGGVLILFLQGGIQGDDGINGGNFQMMAVFFQQQILLSQLLGLFPDLAFQIFLVAFFPPEKHPLFNGPADLDIKKIEIFDGFGNKVIGPEIDRLDREFHGAGAGKKKNGDIELALMQGLDGGKAVHAGHVDVQDDGVNIIIHYIQGGPAIFHRDHLVAEQLENFHHRVTHQRIIIGYENFGLQQGWFMRVDGRH